MRRPQEPLPQRQLVLMLRIALATNDQAMLARLVNDHPIGTTSSYVRHNLGRRQLEQVDALSIIAAPLAAGDGEKHGQLPEEVPG